MAKRTPSGTAVYVESLQRRFTMCPPREIVGEGDDGIGQEAEDVMLTGAPAKQAQHPVWLRIGLISEMSKFGGARCHSGRSRPAVRPAVRSVRQGPPTMKL